MSATIYNLERERAIRHAERLSFAGFFMFSGAFIVWFSIIALRMMERGKIAP